MVVHASPLQPQGYDAQVVYLIAAPQNLGPLTLRYHFTDEAEQIQRLMLPAAAGGEPGKPAPPGLSESAAAFAVRGVDTPSLASPWPSIGDSPTT